MKGLAAICAMAAGFVAIAFLFKIPAGVFGLIGLAGWLLEKPTQRLADSLAVYAERLKAERAAEKQRSTCGR